MISLPSQAADSREQAKDQWKTACVCFNLDGPRSSYYITAEYPLDDLRIDMALSYRVPGVLLDTVGMNPPVQGDWRLELLAAGQLQLSVYAPRVKSAARCTDGWHRLIGSVKLAPQVEYWVNIVVKDGDSGLLVDGQIVVKETLPVALSGSPLYAGDFPRDDGLALEDDLLHPGATATLNITYCGPFVKDVMPDDRRKSVVRPDIQGAVAVGTGSGNTLVTTAEDLAETTVSGEVLDKTGNVTAAQGNKQPPVVQPADMPEAPTPEECVRLFMEAQVRGDVASQLGYVALDGIAAEQQQRLAALLNTIAGKVQLQDFKLDVRATAYGKQGTLALVRCASEVRVAAPDGSSVQRFGSFIVTRKTGKGWKILQIEPDDLLNLALADTQPGIGMAGGGRWPVAFQLPAPAQPGLNQTSLIDYDALDTLFTNTVNGWYFDEGKIWYDEHASFAGWIPLFGDAISAGYTALQTSYTTLHDLMPDIWNGDWEMAGIGVVQVSSGLLQILVEVTPGVDVAADNMGIALDTYKYNVQQARNYSKIRCMIHHSQLQGMKKYLFLRPQAVYDDPERGLSTAAQVNMRLDYYDDWQGEQRPLRKISFDSDIPLRFWKTIDFDIGCQFPIKRSESEALFAAAKSLGLRDRLIPGVVPDYSVSIPVRISGQGPARRLIEGELDPGTLAANPEQEAPAGCVSQGMPVLVNGRLVASGPPGHLVRVLRFDITPTAGPSQQLQVKLLDSEGSLTQPLTVENAVYNNLVGAVPVDSSAQVLPERKILVAQGQTADFLVLGETRNYPLPRIVGLPVSEWQVADSKTASLDVVGRFPDANLRITGLQLGSTKLKYQLLTGDGSDQQVLEGALDLEVIAPGWKLSSVEVIDVLSWVGESIAGEIRNRRMKWELKDGYYCSRNNYAFEYHDYPGLSQPVEAWSEGTIRWNPPPQYIPDQGGVWQLDATLALTLKAPVEIPSYTSQAGSEVVMELAPPARYVDLRKEDNWFWYATMGKPQLHITKTIDLDTWAVRQNSDKFPFAPEGPRVLKIRFGDDRSCIDSFVIYRYEPMQ